MKNLIKQYLLRNRLHFSDELEKLFEDDYFRKTVPITRFALVLAFILYAAFGILDLFISPMTKNITWIIRYAVICPLIVLIFALSFVGIFKKIMQPAIFMLSLAMGFGIIVMITTARSVVGGLLYYAGLILVIVWSYTLVRLKFVNATIVGWIIVIAYEFAAMFYQDLWESDQFINVFINNNFFCISANIIGMFASYYMEMYTRKDFFQRLMIIEEQKKIEKERNILSAFHENMIAELDMARNIQQQIVPHEKPAPYVSALFKPMEPIGGDFYDFIKFSKPDTLGIFLSDVSGHGVPAALITTMIKSIITEDRSIKLDPAQLLMHLNTILGGLMAENFATAFYGIYDKTDRTITYSSAGHIPPYLIHDKTLMTLDKANGSPLGIITDFDATNNGTAVRYTSCVQRLPAPGKILFFTDGLIEARNHGPTPMMFSKIIGDILLALANLPCDEFIQGLYRELVRFRGNDAFDDDVCIICVDVE